MSPTHRNPARHRLADPACRLGLILVGLTILFSPRPAAGHASLVRSDPPANVILETAPQVLRLQYDEDLAPGLSVISILDRSNFVVMQGGDLTDRDRKVLELPVAQLRPGIYTVSWKVLSAVDGHITRGAFAFVFLPPGTDPAKLFEQGRPAVTRQGSSRFLLFSGLVLAGWVHLIALFVGVGGLHFPLVVLGIGRTADRGILAAREKLLGPAIVWAVTASATALISGIVWWEINTHLTSDTTLAHYLFRPALLPYLLASRTSQSMVLRLCLLLLVLVFLHEARKTSPPSVLLLGYCEAVGAVTLLALALSSHSAAAWASPLAVVFDTLHLWAGALWVGGLVVLAVLLPRALGESQSGDWPPLLLPAMRKFTPWAIGSVAVLLLTGAFQVALHIPGPHALVQTEYGRALALKLLLILPLLFLGGVNSLTGRMGKEGHPAQAGSLRHRLLALAVGIQRWGAWRLRAPCWAVRGEVVLGVAVLLCVAFLIQLPPPKAASSAPPPSTLQAGTDGLTIDFTITSPEGLLAPSDLTVRIRQADGRPVEGITRVTVRPSMPGMEMNISPIPAIPLSGGEYRAKTLLSMLGRWEFAVVVRRKGVEEDAVFRFPYVLLDVGRGQTEVGPALPERLSLRAAWSTPSTRWKLLGGAFLILLGLGIPSGLAVGRTWRRRAMLLCLAGLPFLLFGGYQVVNAMVVDTTPMAWQENPVPSDASSLAKGRAIYMATCATCHGESGRTAFPASVSQVPRSFRGADLTGDHMEAHSDGDLFWWISKGIRGTAMPGFEDSLTPEDRWHVVNFIRTLRHQPSARP
jgi:copper transport protein